MPRKDWSSEDPKDAFAPASQLAAVCVSRTGVAHEHPANYSGPQFLCAARRVVPSEPQGESGR